MVYNCVPAFRGNVDVEKEEIGKMVKPSVTVFVRTPSICTVGVVLLCGLLLNQQIVLGFETEKNKMHGPL